MNNASTLRLIGAVKVAFVGIIILSFAITVGEGYNIEAIGAFNVIWCILSYQITCFCEDSLS